MPFPRKLWNDVQDKGKYTVSICAVCRDSYVWMCCTSEFSITYLKFKVISPQLFSSDQSPQSSLKSHTWFCGTHALLLHTNIFSGHEGWGSEEDAKKKKKIMTVKLKKGTRWESVQVEQVAYQAECSCQILCHRWRCVPACWMSWRLQTGWWSPEAFDQPLPRHDATNLHGCQRATTVCWSWSPPLIVHSGL